MEPLFPRLNVKDAEKGGPKGPPRNKMAVYDELLVPSSRLSHGSGVRTPLSSNGIGEMGHAHVGAEKRTASSFCCPPASTTHTTPRLVSSRPSGGYVTLSVSKNPSTTSLPSKFVRLERHSCNEEGPFSARQGESQNSGNNGLKRANVFNLDPENNAKTSPANGQSSSPECQGSNKRLASISAVRANALSHESSKSLLSNAVSESSENATTLSSHASIKADETSETLTDTGTEHLKVKGNGLTSSSRTDCLVPSVSNSNAGPESDSQRTEESENKSLGARFRHENENTQGASVFISPDDVVLKIGDENFWKTKRILINQQRTLSFQVSELHRIVKVQRSFASSPHNSVEDRLCLLHTGFHEVPNIDKVPPPPPPLPRPPSSLPPRPLPPPPSAHLQLKNKNLKMPFPSFLYDPERVSKPSTRFNPTPSPPTPPPLQSNDLCLNTATVPRMPFKKPPFPPLGNNSNKLSLSEYQSSKPTSVSAGTDNSLKPCNSSLVPTSIQRQTGTPLMNSLENQVLVPVMSSEGLVYRPYSGTHPLNVGFTRHLYGSSGPMNVSTPGRSYFLNAAYGVPASQREMMVPGIRNGLSYLNPRGFSATNSTTHEAIDHKVVTEDKSRTVPGSSDDVDRQGSTERSSVGRAASASQGTLSLFPMEPTTTKKLEFAVPTFEKGGVDDKETDMESRAIKSVPLDGRRTAESAMRIYMSIQEERRQNNDD